MYSGEFEHTSDSVASIETPRKAKRSIFVRSSMAGGERLSNVTCSSELKKTDFTVTADCEEGGALFSRLVSLSTSSTSTS